jgi:SAM-dependent methyltransferase
MLSLDRQNRFRQQYQLAYPDWKPATKVYADLVRSYLWPNTRLLDLGCGRGGLVEQLLHPPEKMIGVDADEQSLHEHRLPALPRATAAAHVLPFTVASFDLVISSWLLEHVSAPAPLLREIGRVLRPGGRFIFITPNKRHPLALLNALAGRYGRWQARCVQQLYGRAAADTFPTHYRANSLSDLLQLSRESRLALTYLRHIPDPTYLAFTPKLFRLATMLEHYLPPDRRIHLVGVLTRSEARTV